MQKLWLSEFMSLHFIFGGARSGKSRFAEQLAKDSGLEVVYLATAQVYDDEFAARVKQHKQQRPDNWQTIEVPHYLADALISQATPQRCLLVECLTLWLAQCICDDCAPAEGISWPEQRRLLLDALPTLPGKIILVSNEVGMGIVPLGAINRRFQDESGWLNQALAAMSDKVVFVAAGLPLRLK